MTSQEAESELVRRLVGAGVPVERGLHLEVRNLDGSHVRLAWQVFKEFAQTPVEDLTGEDDQVLFEGGVFDFGPELGGRRYHLAFTRQFAYSVDGEYDHMEQLHCEFFFTPSPILEAAPRDSLWSSGLSWNEFFGRIESMAAFAVPVDSGLVPSGVWLEQEQV